MLVKSDVPDPAMNARRFTDQDRREQLRQFADLCQRIGNAFAEQGDSWIASHFPPLSQRALDLLANGWQQSDLNALGGDYPQHPAPWLHPKMSDYNAKRESWQDSVAEWNDLARRLALDLRTIGTL